MEAVKLQLANRTLLNPASPQWEKATRVDLRMAGTEPAQQPSAYVRTAWAGRQVGAVRSLSVRAAHNRQSLFFRLEWDDATHNPDYGDGTTFPDAAAVLFADGGNPPIALMGSEGTPILGWYWRANRSAGESLRYQGLATERPLDSPVVVTNAEWRDGRWAVVVGAPVESVGSRVGFAVWEGSNKERAGLHSYSPQWQELEVR